MEKKTKLLWQKEKKLLKRETAPISRYDSPKLVSFFFFDRSIFFPSPKRGNIDRFNSKHTNCTYLYTPCHLHILFSPLKPEFNAMFGLRTFELDIQYLTAFFPFFIFWRYFRERQIRKEKEELSAKWICLFRMEKKIKK